MESKCCWCISTCNGSRVPSVAPADSFPVVSANSRKDQDLESRPPIQKQPTTQRVETLNQFNVPDENGIISATATTTTGDFIQSKDCSDFYLQNSVFFEIDDDRRIRVVHLEPKEDQVDSPAAEIIVDTQYSSSKTIDSIEDASSPKDGSPSGKKSGEEEDEYWFQKWTRKPRFRSIFEKNTIHCTTEEEESDNNNTVNSGDKLSKDFEKARAAAAAKRRAWAYNNGGGTEPVVEQFTVIDNDEVEFSSISICDSFQKWSKNGESSGCSSSKDTKTPPNTPRRNSTDNSDGVANLGFEDDEEDNGEVIREMAVDCPPDFVSPVKSLSLKRGGPSPSPSNQLLSPSASSTKENLQTNNKEVLTSPSSIVSENQDLQKKQNPILFLIHGISGSCEQWKSQMEYFHNLGYEIVAPDLLGHGFSSTPNNGKYYHFESLAQDLISVFDYFVEEDRKVVLVGHGYGACLAAVITRVRPKRSKVLISISGGGPTPLINRSCCRGSLIPFYCKFFHNNPAKGRFDNPELHNIIPSSIRKHIINGQIWNDGDSAFYRRITVPTLLVYGMKDKVVNLVEVCEMERTIPKSFLEVVDSAGHMVMTDEPEKLNKMLGKFIQSWV